LGSPPKLKLRYRGAEGDEGRPDVGPGANACRRRFRRYYRATIGGVATSVRWAFPKSVTDAITATAAAIITRLDVLCMAGQRGRARLVPGTPQK
jgi:glyoxylate carboligase